MLLYLLSLVIHFGLQVSASNLKCNIENPFTSANVAIGFPRVANRAPSTGTLNLKVIFVDFSDAPATDTPQQVFAYISPNTEQFFASVSYGHFTVNLSPYYKWLRMSKVSTAYSMSPSISFASHRAYLTEAANLASSDSVDFSTFDEIIVMTNPTATAIAYGPAFCSSTGNGVTIKGKEFINSVTSGRDLIGWNKFWLIHELSHTLGLPDLYSFSGPLFGFTGDWSIMGNINGNAREYFAWERWLLGWLSGAQYLCITSKSNTTAILSPIENLDSSIQYKAVIVPLTQYQAVVIESRRNRGYDTITKEGILVYLVDSTLATGNGVIQVIPINTADQSKKNNIVGVGESVSCSTVTVNYVSNTNDLDTILVISNSASVRLKISFYFQYLLGAYFFF